MPLPSNPSHLAYAYQVQLLLARVEALSAAGDALKRLVPKDSAKSRRVIESWELTKVGGKRADRKRD